MESKLNISQLSDIARRIMPSGSKVWLYGSRARGDERQDSDWDILVIMDKDTISNDDFNKYSFPLIEFGWKHAADLSPQMYTKKEWESMRITPYYRNVERDKKVIYES